MRKIWLCFSILLFPLSLLLPTTVSAHAGPPFIKINGQLNVQNQIFSGSSLFKVTYESSLQNYLVGDNLNFQIEPSLLPVDPSTVGDSNFIWDFGDKSPNLTGLNVNHQFSKSGSFFVILKVKDPNYQDPIELESITVNVLPSKNYTLPTAVIKVNGKTYSDPLKNPIVLSNGESVNFDATSSKGDIKSYKWDFSDGSKLVTGSKVSHNFNFSSPYSYSFFPILRVEDKNGLIADTLVQITNKAQSGTTNVPAKKAVSAPKTSFNPTLLIIAAVVLIALGIGGFILLKRKRS